MRNTPGYKTVAQWFTKKGWQPAQFQEDCWEAYLNQKSGLLNAPTGSGKTMALFMPMLIDHINKNENKKPKGLKQLWITPLRALSNDIANAMEQVVADLNLDWEIGSRTGDTLQKTRVQQLKKMPQTLITTPESLHVLFTTNNHEALFKDLELVVVDEWHDLLGGKRGVQMELALIRLKEICHNVKTWGISATIGNLDEALEVLLGKHEEESPVTITAIDNKIINFETIFPDEIEAFPWAGHMGIKLVAKLIPIIRKHKSILIFTNTRNQTEVWYQRLLDLAPDLAGTLAIHHSALDTSVRTWVEQALHDGILKAVVCTASLDLGVDFRPVDAVVQIGSPKGVARFMQRAGRSGHSPGASSKIYFFPTNSLELMEASALKHAIGKRYFESKYPIHNPFDVLIQYLLTLAVGGGFEPESTYFKVIKTYAFRFLTKTEYYWIINFITTGGSTLAEYDEYQKASIVNGLVLMNDKRAAMRHRLSIGTILSDTSVRVEFQSGGRIGNIEEYFISKLKIGDVFYFAGKNLEIIRFKDMVCQVRKSNRKNGIIPSWQGGKMPFSTQLSELIRLKCDEASNGEFKDPEMEALIPLFYQQMRLSTIPAENQTLIEYVKTREGYHLFLFPFEGRLVHEGMAALLAYRIGQITPLTFSIAMNDYGFELLSDQPIPIDAALENDLFSLSNLSNDIYSAINAAEMARRQFREICRVSGLIFQGYPGVSQQVSGKHLRSSAHLLFDVFYQYEPDSLLIQQAFEQVMNNQLDEMRLRKAFKRIQQSEIILNKTTHPSPFAFPILCERLREKLTTESLEDRVKKMLQEVVK